uniref:Beta a protein n=1 Tax=Barley stripe mosaic virus TaxID=12327 RepID=A0A2K9YRQ2_BSMV|nr:beta a protein [Barley stripe mosaic virus]AUW36689.1 beta a protein [Barley stripe mosaic virus]
MPNVSLTAKGGGHYNEDQWDTQVVEAGVFDDWWVHVEAWNKFLDNLRGINFSVASSRSQVAEYLAALDRDLPADVDRRFAGARGQIGLPNYLPAPKFFRLDKRTIAELTRLSRLTDQPHNNRDIELNRAKRATTNPTPPAQAPSENLTLRDVQPLKDSALHYQYVLIDLQSARLPVYTRKTFERELALEWIIPDAEEA